MPGGAPSFEIFLSYSRKDNAPRQPGDTRGWVTALRDEILADNRRFSTEPLRIFFDTSAIKDMDDWRHRILEGLRHSRILLVCLSPDYFASDYCRWEFDEYVQRQVHALMGHDSFAQVYFAEVPGVSEQEMAKGWYELLRRTNYTDLRPWFPLGVEALREVAVREKIASLGTSLWERIQRARRATGVPGNIRRLNPHFIGRRTELRQLHENLALGAVGVVTAVHGLGGQGKTELATAYAHGRVDSYPAGLWVLGVEGKKELLPLLGKLCAELQIPLTTGPDETADARVRRVLAELQRRATTAAPRDPDKGAACLVILDNVSEPSRLAEPQLAHIPREYWLRVVVTTREGPEKFPASRQKSLAFIAVDALTDDDAARLIEDHQIVTNGQWPAATAAADAAAARVIARELGGFTLAVESVAIYLGLHPDIRPADYLARLHRMVAAHLRERMGDRTHAALRTLRHAVEQFALALQHDILHDPAAHRWQIVPLQEAVRHWREGEQDTALGHIAGVVGDIEAQIGRLDVAETFLGIANETLEQIHAADPQSEVAARDVSLSLEKLADILARRGQPGDATQVLGHSERSLAVRERLLLANPESVSYARDVVVSHYKLAQFGQQAGDQALAMRHFTACHALLHRYISASVTFDPPIMGLYQQLHAAVGGGC